MTMEVKSTRAKDLEAARAMASAAGEETVTFDFCDKTFEGYNIEIPSRSVTMTQAEAIKLYRDMQT
ncbi:hypothetical protein GGI06_000464, partial [Coemansia sp. S85]